MAWANLVRSYSRAVSSGSKICSKQSGKYAKIRAAIHFKVMLQTQTPPMRVMRTFSGVNNSLCNMVNNRSHHDFHSTTIASSSATSVEKAASPPILLMGEDIFDTFTHKAKEVIKFAQMEARASGYKFVGTEMILLGLIGDGTDKFLGESTDIAEMVLLSMNIRLDDARKKVIKIFGCTRPPSLSVSVEIPFRPSTLRAFERSLAEARQLAHNYIGSEHLLLGLLGDEDVNLLLEKLGASPIEIRIQVMRMIEESAAQVVADGRSSGNEMPTLEEEYGLNITDEKKSHPFVQDNKMPILEDKMGWLLALNLTEQACKKEWWHVVERKPLINTLIQILGRRSKNNAFLIGEKGVGKSSVLLGLVQRIRDLDVPDFLSNKKVIALDEKYPYDRYWLLYLMDEITKCNEIIIYIEIVVDTPYNLGDSNIDPFVDIMMPIVAGGYAQCVISATPDVYLRMKKYPNFLKFMRLFQPINVPATTVDETIEILKGIQKKLEMTHKVRYTDEALVAAVHMSDQFLRHDFHPVKAMDVMDFAGGFVFKKEIQKVRNQEMGHKNMLEIEQIIKRFPPTVTKADIENVVSDFIKI